MLCLNLLIHFNYGHSYKHGKHRPSESSVEEDLVDLYGKSDEYSNESVKETQTKNGYRQLGLIGNSISSHSFRNCRHLENCPNGCQEYYNCVFTNDESNHQNIIQLAKTLATEVQHIKKRLNRLSRRIGYRR